jgi:hypothetical protein
MTVLRLIGRCTAALPRAPLVVVVRASCIFVVVQGRNVLHTTQVFVVVNGSMYVMH